ncbi:helix-turn-helix transcriptional regulator [Streptomyces sp. TRM72054]|uniref:helix-turn-helix domain-containing protein n=1 Tax=Streptomyces sp. TRM72054 TaxID=2870562 RepID=UPI001C8C0D82|nr:helix-turn-helix transcriptional regulator [Streptomyces sp. TRM72054]MBX9399345.1 helix-turn-helix transcriptional regulator [Streptomyces sp. TRM72054]
MDVPLSFGGELRRLRESANMTLEEVSKEVSCSKGHLCKIERGDKKPTQGLARRCDAFFGTGGRLARMLDTSTSTGTGRAQGRREVLATGVGSLLAGALEGQGRGLWEGDAALPPTTLFHDQLQQIRMLGQAGTPTALLASLSTQVTTITRMATHCLGRPRSELLVSASRFAEYAGWMAQEAGRVADALDWTAQAVELAQAGGDTDLADYAMVRRALIALYNNDARQTVELVEKAQHSRVRPRIRGLATQRAAQGHALAGDESACLNELDRARALLAVDDASNDGPVLGPTHVPDLVSVVTGWCLHDLGRHQEAAEILDRECRRVPSHAVRTRVRYGLRRALAHAASGEIEHACAVTRELLMFTDLAPSATIRTEVRRLDRELGRFRSHPAVREVRPGLAHAMADH